jgi:hypothetical protein
MKLIDIHQRKDYGRDIYFILLQIKSWCLIQSCFHLMLYGRSFPYLNISFGSGRLLGINFQVLSFGFTVEFLSRSWFK